MKIDMDALMIFLMMWGIPTFTVVRGYLKMSEEEQKEAMTDFKSLRFIFTIGFITIGAVFATLGGLLKVDSIKISGNIVIAIGITVSIVRMWKSNKLRSILLFLVLLLLLAIIT
ncbi:hypothetical protein [Bacillus sp. REN10]|uniref:hypothetical protein n=1 Tax=Bacillus sp. REN10 TaxID=2782541 RepID=UPI00193BAF3B|nr:hypothetical protein [Bacillus sp. REN10]